MMHGQKNINKMEAQFKCNSKHSPSPDSINRLMQFRKIVVAYYENITNT
jgi:hypothetical protein